MLDFDVRLTEILFSELTLFEKILRRMVGKAIFAEFGMDKLNIRQDHFVVLNSRDASCNGFNLSRVPGEIDSFNCDVFEAL